MKNSTEKLLISLKGVFYYILTTSIDVSVSMFVGKRFTLAAEVTLLQTLPHDSIDCIIFHNDLKLIGKSNTYYICICYSEY